MRKTAFIIALLCTAVLTNAQQKEERKYNKRAQEVDEEIMTKPDPLFTSNTIPDALGQSSAVIIAKKIDIYTEFKKKTKYTDAKSLAANTTRYFLTIREKVKLLDKNALNEYSEFSFSKIRKQSNFFKRSAFFFLGIRLIKPDGSIKIINVDEEAVNAPGEDEKENYKLAIPGLEVGDIVDMYARVEQESQSDRPIDPLDIVLGGEYSVLKYSFTIKVQNEFGIIYSLANGAPEVERTQDDDFVYLKMQMENVNKTTDEPWIYERRELPVIRVSILPGADVYSTERFSLKRGQVLKELPKSWIDDYFVTNYGSLYWRNPSERLTQFKEYLKKATNGKQNRLSEDSLVSYIYYYGRYIYLYDKIADDEIETGADRNGLSATYRFLEFLLEALNDYTIQYDFICTVPRGTGTIYNVISPAELIPIIRVVAGNTKYYLTPPDMFSIVNSFPYYFEGQEGYLFENMQYLKKGYRSEIGKVPLTKSSFNFAGEDLTVTINPEKPQQLYIKRIRTERGNAAYDDQVKLLLFEDYVDAERQLFFDGPLSEEISLKAGKKNAQLLEEYKKSFAESRKKRLEYARKELESTFETKSIVLDSFKILKRGARHDRTDFVYEEKFSMDGVLKKAGPNYILDVSSLIGSQMQIKPEQRKRAYNINMPYARSYDYSISLVIPKGFQVQGLENLQKNVSNETGSFISTATVENDKLMIKATKTYSHNYENVASWDKMLLFIDAAYNFSQEKVLLKKI